MIVFVKDIPDYPKVISASGKKKLLICKAIKYTGLQVVIVNNYLSLPEKSGSECLFEEITLLKKNLYPRKFKDKTKDILVSLHREIKLLLKHKKSDSNLVLFMSIKPFPLVVYYYLLSKLLSIKLVYLVEEYSSFLIKKYHPHRRLKYVSVYLFDHYLPYFCNGIVVISTYLQQHFIQINEKLPLLRIPILEDFSTIKKDPKSPNENEVFFTASAGHLNLFKFVLDVFNSINNSGMSLNLVTQGKKEQILKILDLIAKYENNNIFLHTNLDEIEYRNLLADASIVLAPLKDDIQDRARFPHKIAEYCLASKAIVTSPIGELPKYFNHEVNIIFANPNSIDDYGSKIKEYITKKVKLEEIGKRSFEIGATYFDYRRYTNSLHDFFFNI